MKKTITLSSILMLIAFILPSCGMNVVKRQHQPGYYISTNPHYKNSKNKAEETPNDVAKETLRPETVGTRKSETVSKGSETVNEEVAVIPAVENNSSNENVIDPKSAQENVVTTYNDQSSSHKKTFIENRFVEKALDRMPKTKKLDAKIKQEQASSARGDGLSLFWIVILVLLLLYVLGVTGHWFPGGLIHVLLVIALVLLILWLLGVV